MIRQFEETIPKLERNIATAIQEASQAAEEMIAQIRKSKREVIASLESTRVTRLERINCAMKEVQPSQVKQMNQAVDFANNLIQRSSSSDVMRNKETLKQRFEVLRKIKVPKHDGTSFVKFTAAPVKDLKLGFIETIPKADANRSTLKGLEQTLQQRLRYAAKPLKGR